MPRFAPPQRGRPARNSPGRARRPRSSDFRLWPVFPPDGGTTNQLVSSFSVFQFQTPMGFFSLGRQGNCARTAAVLLVQQCNNTSICCGDLRHCRFRQRAKGQAVTTITFVASRTTPKWWCVALASLQAANGVKAVAREVFFSQPRACGSWRFEMSRSKGAARAAAVGHMRSLPWH